MIVVKKLDNLMDRRIVDREECAGPLAMLEDLMRLVVDLRDGPWMVMINGKLIEPEAMADTVVMDGEEVFICVRPAEPATIALIAIAVASAAASAFLVAGLKVGPSGNGDAAEKRFGFNRYSSDGIPGEPIQVVLGSNPRYGGKVIAQVPGLGVDGNNRLRMLIACSRGQVSRIANQTGDFNKVAAASLPGMFLNDTPIASFPGCFVSGRMGTSGQAVIAGFADTEVLREVGVNGVLLRNTSGSDRTSGTASGEAFTFATIDPVESVLVRIRFAKGLFTVSDSGQYNAKRVQYRVRTRTTAGPGSWSAWTNVAIDKAEQSDFVSAFRIDGLGNVRTDVQCERITKEPTSASSVDEMKFDSLVEIKLSTNNYPGVAVLALDLAASEQLASVPRVSFEIDGYAGMQIWDGTSPATAPVFTTGFSRNPAALFLEAITNTTWGMGTTYTIADVDMVSLLEWWADCDVLVPTADGGTRKRYACDLVMDTSKDGIDWLRMICATGRAVPVVVGNKWRIVQNKARTYPVEIFTDATVATDGDGKPDMVITRTLTTGGYQTANRLTAQYKNDKLGGRTDVAAWPAFGALWLGSPLNEPVRQEDFRIDGVTDPEQLLAELKYDLRKRRFIERTVSFVTTKPVVVVQPGDRFDLASSVPQWGTASGRVRAGATATSVKLDRSLVVTLGMSVTIEHEDGSIETQAVTAAPGTYAAGAAINTTTWASTPAEFESYSVGTTGVVLKPFICSRVSLEDAERLTWRVEGYEYVAAVYDEAAEAPSQPVYSQLGTSISPPGPVTGLIVNEQPVTSGTNVVRQVSLAWGQSLEDASITGSFRIGRRLIGTTSWVIVPSPSVARRSYVVDVTDLSQAFEFAVLAVGTLGTSLSFDDPRVLKVTLAYGLGTTPPAPPTGLTLTQIGTSYKLTWTPVDGASGYQVLFGGDTTSGPNVGAEDCLVAARTTDAELAGLVLPAGQACRFFVRSVSSTLRPSFTASTINLSSPAVPAGMSIESTRTFALNSEGTRTNVTWDSGQSRLELTSPSSDGVYLTPEIDRGTLAAGILSLRIKTANDAADPTLDSDPFTVPSVAADQWGVVSVGPAVVGMLMPPFPDDEQTWLIEARTYDGVIWRDWSTISKGGLDGIGAGSLVTFSKYQIRVTMRRAHAPYRPALRGLVAVVMAS